MTWLSTMFHQGGLPMWWILALVLPSLAIVGVHIGLRRRWSLWMALGAIALMLGIGLFGTMSSRRRIDTYAAEAASEQERALVVEEGYKEASRPIQFAGVVGAILLVGVIIGQLRRR
jgi:hypothetical protein